MRIQPRLIRFKENVLSKFQIYNSIFMTLPFDAITRTGVLLPLFHDHCKTGFAEGKDPSTIIEEYFDNYLSEKSYEDRTNLLFRFIQYIERQVVLFDAIEDAAFPVVHNLDGIGTLRSLKESAKSDNKLDELRDSLEDFKVRVVLTAHPTQFYPGTVLGIITDLTEAIRANDLKRIKDLLAQLGKTPFFKKKKPTPYDEAVSLIWYLENVFYLSAGQVFEYIRETIFEGQRPINDMINIGFWPGGDRDGNPFVTPEITLKVARRLKQTIIRNYYKDVRALRRKLTFKGVYDKVLKLERLLYQSSLDAKKDYISLDGLTAMVLEIRDSIIDEHQGLYLHEIDLFLDKVHLFGYHFASLDIRQDSRVHHKVFTKMVEESFKLYPGLFPKDYQELIPDRQIEILSGLKGHVEFDRFEDELVRQTLETIAVMKTIQQENGEKGSNRYIISNNQTALNVMELFAMLKLSGFEELMPVDMIPLFETVDDLKRAPDVMEQLYTNPSYKAHLQSRGNKQTIMLGFSDGTKDGGYLMANWAIFKAKEELTTVAKAFDVDVMFFDGRGGPPARGGGKTNQFYASLGPTIADKEIQLTIQGQTISSNFGTLESAQYNLEQLISAGISNKLEDENLGLEPEHRKILLELSDKSYDAYQAFKDHPKFISYLENMSTLKYYAMTNIGSRPSKRSNSDSLVFSDLRAIPFVGSWSQLKQNVPGFYGLGTALKYYEDNGKWEEVRVLYEHSKFFKTLLANSMMSLSKSFFGLTAYMSDDPE
ncbi:MAG: phosphoenolpyruvate carboxylase, partial [Flavobacteriaceae bacterium]|nr:phosphoenolpyruvate carboxylase [Flavobacteriaceae bacterium]